MNIESNMRHVVNSAIAWDVYRKSIHGGFDAIPKRRVHQAMNRLARNCAESLALGLDDVAKEEAEAFDHLLEKCTDHGMRYD